MLELLTDPQAWISLLTLTALEIVLGIDNLVFLSLMTAKLPRERQSAARRFGLVLALISRLALLASIAWIATLTHPLFTVWEKGFSARDLILILGGLFLLYKGTVEIHERVEEPGEEEARARKGGTFMSVIIQIMVLDIVFSLDSVITAVGMAQHLEIMMAAIIAAVIVMLLASDPLAHFIERHPTVKMLALSFLLLVGMVLVADGFGMHVPKGYVYAAIGFSVGVEMLNIVARGRKAKASGPPPGPVA